MTGKRGIDHLVLAVRDLEAAAGFYRALGFQVGARNRHPWGTENHVVQFGSSFLELIAVAEPGLIPPHAAGAFSFGAFVRDYLSVREGFAMLALDSVDAVSDAAAFAEAGIGDFAPFSFERAGRAADESETRVAFTLAFALDDRIPDASFFVCQQHFPDAFWSPALQQHPNGAIDVTAVDLSVAVTADHVPFLQTFTGVTASADGAVYRLARGGALRVTSAEAPRGLTGFQVGVANLTGVAQRLVTAGIPFTQLAEHVMVGPEAAFGTRIAFALTG